MGFKIESLKTADYSACIMLPGGYSECRNYRNCTHCEIADLIRGDIATDAALFGYRDALPQTPGGCRNFCNKPLILSKEVMERLKIKVRLINQIMIAEPSPGCFYQNPVGVIDGYLLNKPSQKITVTRNEVYGVPNPRAVERFDELFFLRLSRFLEKE